MEKIQTDLPHQDEKPCISQVHLPDLNTIVSIKIPVYMIFNIHTTTYVGVSRLHSAGSIGYLSP